MIPGIAYILNWGNMLFTQQWIRFLEGLMFWFLQHYFNKFTCALIENYGISIYNSISLHLNYNSLLQHPEARILMFLHWICLIFKSVNDEELVGMASYLIFECKAYMCNCITAHKPLWTQMIRRLTTSLYKEI